MRGADKNAALALGTWSRRTLSGSGRQTRFADATSEQWLIDGLADRAKAKAKIDIAPFVPSHSAFCRKAETALLWGVPLAALAAALALAVRSALQ